jgi:hypothetical protein
VTPEQIHQTAHAYRVGADQPTRAEAFAALERHRSAERWAWLATALVGAAAVWFVHLRFCALEDAQHAAGAGSPEEIEQ